MAPPWDSQPLASHRHSPPPFPHIGRYVDTQTSGLLDIYLNITFPNVACDILTLDVMDGFGESQVNVEHNIHKRKLDRQGNDLNAVTKVPTVASGTGGQAWGVDPPPPQKRDRCFQQTMGSNPQSLPQGCPQSPSPPRPPPGPQQVPQLPGIPAPQAPKKKWIIWYHLVSNQSPPRNLT